MPVNWLSMVVSARVSMRQCLISLLIDDSANEMKSGIVAVRSSRFKKLAIDVFNSVNVEIAINKVPNF
jgi:hypothetical protein